MSSHLESAERIAREAHATQIEESTGDPYIRHIERVVAMVDGDHAKAVAWLHDVLEDCPEWTLVRLGKSGIRPAELHAVVLLTRGHPFGSELDTYEQHIDKIHRSGNGMALAVKIADLRDHLRPNCPERLRPRYERALAALTTKAETQQP